MKAEIGFICCTYNGTVAKFFTLQPVINYCYFILLSIHHTENVSDETYRFE